MIRKIVSNGRIGVARGALDAALALDVPHGGCMLPGDPDIGDPLPEKYRLQETRTGSLTKCVERNVRDTDGTLILTFSDDWPDDASCARKSADKYHTPWLHIDLDRTGEFEAAQSIHEWVKELKVEAVHVVGACHGSPRKTVEKITTDLLEAVYYLGLIESNMQATTKPDTSDREAPPKSIDELVSRILADMTLKDRVIVANFQESRLDLLQTTLGRYIIVQIEYWQKSQPNIFSLFGLEENIADAEGAAAVVIKKLWAGLRETHRLRMVK
jgi:hypothetical protein